jgi:N-dimethylarginine dimethylaminohydrolase
MLLVEIHFVMSTQPIEITGILPAATVPLAPPQADFLMCPPKLYDVTYVINPWMDGNIHASSQTRAAEQWQHLYEAVSRVATVHLVDPQPGSPDMVFTANAGLERNGTVVISSFFHSERQGEEQHFRQWFRNAGYTIREIPRSTPFEGEGDALFSTDGKRLWAGYGPRSLPTSHQALRDAWSIEVTPLHLIDPRFYHLDTCFAPLEGGYAMYFPEAFDRASLECLEAFYPIEKRIVVTQQDALRFACNAINVGRTIIMNEISRELADRLHFLGFEVIQIALSEFLKAGGAAKCLVMKLSPPSSSAHQHIV